MYEAVELEINKLLNNFNPETELAYVAYEIQHMWLFQQQKFAWPNEILYHIIETFVVQPLLRLDSVPV